MNRPTFTDLAASKETIVIVGLGYAGQPSAALSARKFRVIGYGINPQRINELESGLDRTRELSPEQLVSVIHPPWRLRVSRLSSISRKDRRFAFLTVPKKLQSAAGPLRVDAH